MIHIMLAILSYLLHAHLPLVVLSVVILFLLELYVVWFIIVTIDILALDLCTIWTVIVVFPACYGGYTPSPPAAQGEGNLYQCMQLQRMKSRWIGYSKLLCLVKRLNCVSPGLCQ